MGLRVQLLGAGHQTCGWRCGYVCLWWALSIGSKGEIPSPGDLPQALPKMQKAFPALCQSLLRGRSGESQPGRHKRTRPPEPPSSPARGMPVYPLDPNNVSSKCSALGSAPASRVGHPGFDSQHVYIPPGDWTFSNLSNLSNCSPSLHLDNDRVAYSQCIVYKESMTRALSAAIDNYTSSTCSALGSTPAPHAGHPGFEPQHVRIIPQDLTLSNISNIPILSNLLPSMDLAKDRVACSQSMVTQGHYPSEPPDTVLGRIYIPPPPPTATPQQLRSLCSPVPPPKRRRANPPEYCENIYSPAHGPQCASTAPTTAPATGVLDRTGIG